MSQHLGPARSWFLLALAASLTTCRLDKLIKPTIADRLAVSPDSVTASANLGSTAARADTLRIASADDATLSWSASTTAPWITLSPNSGGAPDSLVVTLHPDTLSQVLHEATIVLTSPQASDTVRVPVRFTILPPAPELSVSPTTHADTAFVGSALTQTFILEIGNTGSIPLTWDAVSNATWLTLSQDSGGAPPLDSSITTLTPGTLAAGTHTGTVTVTSPGATGSPIAVAVNFVIRPCAEVTVVPDAVVTGSVTLGDCGAPQRAGSQAKLYAVQATAGDTLSFRLSAAFDAYLVLTNSAGTAVLDQNDECPGFTGTACIMNFIVPATGRYVIEATTAAAAATGAFTLSVARERTPNAPAAGQFRADSVTAIAAGAETPQNVVVFKATLSDPNPGDSVRLETELVGLAGGTRTDSSAWAPPGTAVAIRVSGLIENAGYHWRARTCDKTGRCSVFVSFGANQEAAADFFVNVVEETPSAPAQLNQFRADGVTSIAVGGLAGNTSAGVVLTGLVTDPDPGAVLLLEVEVKGATVAGPDGTGLARGSTGVLTNGTATVALTLSGALLVGTNYYWRARACDQTNRCGDWVSFAANKNTSGGLLDPADTDFRVGP